MQWGRVELGRYVPRVLASGEEWWRRALDVHQSPRVFLAFWVPPSSIPLKGPVPGVGQQHSAASPQKLPYRVPRPERFGASRAKPIFRILPITAGNLPSKLSIPAAESWDSIHHFGLGLHSFFLDPVMPSCYPTLIRLAEHPPCAAARWRRRPEGFRVNYPQKSSLITTLCFFLEDRGFSLNRRTETEPHLEPCPGIRRKFITAGAPVPRAHAPSFQLHYQITSV